VLVELSVMLTHLRIDGPRRAPSIPMGPSVGLTLHEPCTCLFAGVKACRWSCSLAIGRQSLLEMRRARGVGRTHSEAADERLERSEGGDGGCVVRE
jgi:hypothetical protein